MNSQEIITERSFYPPIINLIKHIGEKLGVSVRGVSEVGVGDRYPDIIVELDSQKLYIQIKIDTLQKLLDDLSKTYPIATKYGAGMLLILLPPEVRKIHPLELERVIPVVKVKRALALGPWISRYEEEATLEDVLIAIIKELKVYEKVQKPSVDYLTIAYVAREAVEELASVMREVIRIPRILNQAQAIIGSFDFYRTLLSEAVEEEEIMNSYIADIVAYLTILNLLFLHVASFKIYNQSILPRIENPLQPPQNLLDIIDSNVRKSVLIKDYPPIVNPFLYVLDMLKNMENVVIRLAHILARYIYAIQVLRPEHVREELFGRIYQETLPPETRKNLGAFFTNPVAARILAYLAIDEWDDKVLDPACGSGTLLASAYEAKMEKALAQGIDRRKAHELFIKEHIMGIDIMQFATRLTSINLTLQNVETPMEPAILWGDGIEKMIAAVRSTDDPPQGTTLYDFILEQDREKYLRYMLPKEGFDVVIMNPPFTRRERIPESERKRLSKMLGDIVKGKVGYWAYFFVAADNVIRPGGRLATVTPEEFFVGGSAESVRRYLFKGEISKDDRWVKVANRTYMPQIIIKSAVDVAFSEQAHYRDYLVVFRKVPEEESKANDKCVVVTLKKALEELKGKERDIAMRIRNLLLSEHSTSTSNEFFDAIILSNISSLAEKYIDNLKPLVFFNSMKTLEFFHEIVSIQGLKRLDEIADLRDYTCQYTGTGFEEYARRLFISRYESRAPTISFRFESEVANSIRVRIGRHGISFSIPKSACIYALRTCANVKHMDVSGEEEYAIVNPQVVNKEYLTLAGLIDRRLLRRAANDIRSAYNAIAGHILLARRLRLTSSNVYWLAFYSNNRIIGPSAPLICLKLKKENLDHYKILALYLNSSITFLQLLAYLAMTEGAWVAIHSKQAWSNVRLPDLELLPESVVKEALQVFNEIAKNEAQLQPLYSRYIYKSSLQKKIDRVALRMLGLEWTEQQLEALYDAIKFELDMMQAILEKSQRTGEAVRKESEEGDGEAPGTKKGKVSRLDKWMKG
jgi:predicted RNA methylase